MIERSPFPLEGGRAGDGGDYGLRPAPGSVKRARRLRKEQTVAERALWAALRAKKMNFRRQAPIGPYVADFVHHASRLVVEVDGYYHTTTDGALRDLARDAWLEGRGYRTLRFPEALVRDEIESVTLQIVAAAASPPSPTLPPSRGKGGVQEC